MASGSVWRPMSWRPARALRPCYRCVALCRTCLCLPRSRPITLPPSCSRQRYAASMSHATATLTERAQSTGIEALTLSPALGDFNEDLRQLGADELRAALRVQLTPEDVPRFLSSNDTAGTMSVRPSLQSVHRIGSR